MICDPILHGATVIQKKTMNAPVRIFPRCHPKCHFTVHVDGRKGIIYLSCSKCDRPVTKIKVKGTDVIPIKPGVGP